MILHDSKSPIPVSHLTCTNNCDYFERASQSVPKHHVSLSPLWFSSQNLPICFVRWLSHKARCLLTVFINTDDVWCAIAFRARQILNSEYTRWVFSSKFELLHWNACLSRGIAFIVWNPIDMSNILWNETHAVFQTFSCILLQTLWVRPMWSVRGWTQLYWIVKTNKPHWKERKSCGEFRQLLLRNSNNNSAISWKLSVTYRHGEHMMFISVIFVWFLIDGIWGETLLLHQCSIFLAEWT